MHFYAKSIFIVLFSMQAFAESFIVNIERQQEKKESTRWTLSDWLAQKERVKLMDQWLAMNTEEIGLEFSLFAQSLKYSEDPKLSEKSASAYELAVLYRFFGFGFSQIPSIDNGSLSSTYFIFRILGSSNQSTQFNLLWGSSTWQNFSGNKKVDMKGANFQFYLANFLGISLGAEHYGNSESISENAYQGRKQEASLFLESGFIRVFYKAYKLELKSNTQNWKEKGAGLGVGFQF